MNVLLHACCAPCASSCVLDLRERGHSVTLFFSNANISPGEEFARRLDAVRRLAAAWDTPLLEDPACHDDWMKRVAVGHEQDPERGARCAKCFQYSLSRARDAMLREGFDAFATSLTVSPHKHTPTLLKIGLALDPVRFLALDFKKRDGFGHSLRLAAELGLYRQTYCGCPFSAFDRRIGFR